jgi:ribose 1,5-bisphosphokinase PhnN
MSIKFTTKGDWGKTYSYLKRLQSNQAFAIMEKYGQRGVTALSAATPVDSSETANSWIYEVVRRKGYFAIHWHNTHMEDGIPIAVILQYGHGTGTGGYVEGRDYIMPAIQPIFDEMVNEIWREVTR